MAVYNILLDFFIYGFLGWCTEVVFAAVRQRKFVNRGFLNGPLCPIYGIGVTVVVVLLESCTENLAVLYFASAILVTILEYLAGMLLEKLFHHKWWDYSRMPLNIKGYVCIPFSLIWGAACVLVVRLFHPFLHKVLSLVPIWLGMILLILLSMGLTADIAVTVFGILKWNRRLDKMEDIAEELHALSDKMGENIYQNVMIRIEKQEELKKKYNEMAERQERTGKRLMKAFPTMKSKKHQEQIAELKAYLKQRG